MLATCNEMSALVSLVLPAHEKINIFSSAILQNNSETKAVVQVWFLVTLYIRNCSLLKTPCHVVQRLIKSSRVVSRFNKLKLADVSGTISVSILRLSEVNRTRHEAKTEKDDILRVVCSRSHLRRPEDGDRYRP
jgi:hypothetical protein